MHIPNEWKPIPKNKSIPVLKERPGLMVVGKKVLIERCYTKDARYYHCRTCGGWIEGDPRAIKVESYGTLAHVLATEYYCKRCGNDMAIQAIVS